MRFLRSAKFELDEKGLAKLAEEMSDFLRVGSFTLSEWESLSETEQAVAVHTKRMLKLEEALLLRRAFTVQSVEDAAAFLGEAGDKKAEAKVILKEATQDLARGMMSDNFLAVTR